MKYKQHDKTCYYILLVGMGIFALDALLVVFAGGLSFQLGWLTIRSTTVEFPIIALSCIGLFLLIIRGQHKEVLLVIASLSFALVVGEGALRIIDHPLSRPYVDFSNWYEPSDIFGHKLVPNFEGFGPLKVPVKINSHGFRDEEHLWEKVDGTVRILGLGDSFLFGWGVRHDETFLKQLEGLLGRAAQKPIETINSGVPGWGLSQYYLYLKHFGVRYSPDVVVLAYFADDLNASSIQEIMPADEQYRGGLKYKGGAFHLSRLYNFVKSLCDQVRDNNRSTRVDYLYNFDARRAEWAKLENYLLAQNGQTNSQKYEHLLVDYLTRINRIIIGDNAVLVVVYIPDISQISHPEVQHINHVLAVHTKEQGIPFVDMTPIFERASDYGVYYLYPQDPHTNSNGHKEMARSLADLICHSVPGSVLSCHAFSS